MEIPVLIWSVNSSILSSTSFPMDKTFWGVGSAAVEQSRLAQGDRKFGRWGRPQATVDKIFMSVEPFPNLRASKSVDQKRRMWKCSSVNLARTFNQANRKHCLSYHYFLDKPKIQQYQVQLRIFTQFRNVVRWMWKGSSVNLACTFTRRTLTQFWSFKIRRTKLLNYVKFADLLILRL